MKGLALALALSLAPALAQAQSNCMVVTRLYQLLAMVGEERVMSGLEPSGMLIEVWANHDTGEWTLFFTRPDGVACPLAIGSGFTRYAAEPNL